MLILCVITFGAVLYAQAQENNLRASAVAYTLKPQDYLRRDAPEINLALCQRNGEVVGIGVKPSLYRFGDMGTRRYTLAIEQSSQSGNTPFTSDVRANRAWYKGNPTDISFVGIKRDDSKPWMRVAFFYDFGDENPIRLARVMSNKFHVGYIPNC